MAFTDFKSIADVARDYQTILQKGNVFTDFIAMPLPDWFMEDLQYSLTTKKTAPAK